MKILYILQQSVYNNEGKWSIADSNINMMTGILIELLKKTDWEFDIVIAPLSDFHNLNSFNDIIKSDRIKFIEHKVPVDAFLNRQNFDAIFFENLLKNNYNIIWNNIIENSRNIQTILHHKKLQSKLISCNYWIDAPELNECKVDKKISYDWRQFDGAECSNIIPFTCASTKESFLQNAQSKFSEKYINKIAKKSSIWDFGFLASELDSFKTKNKFDKTTILFPNRLSGINYTHHKEFINAVNEIYEYRKDFQVVFTNPSSKVSWDWLKNNVKPLHIYKQDILSRKEYIELLWMSDIIISLYTNEKYGGCSNREGIYCECFPVMTSFGEYKNLVQKDYNFVNLDMSNLKEIIENSINKHSTSDNSFSKSTVFRNSSFEMVSDKVIKDIMKIYE